MTDKETPWRRVRRRLGASGLPRGEGHRLESEERVRTPGEGRMFQTGATSSPLCTGLSQHPTAQGLQEGKVSPLRGSPGLLRIPGPQHVLKGERGTGHRSHQGTQRHQALFLLSGVSPSQAKATSWISRQCVCFRRSKVHLGSERHHSILCPGAWIVLEPILATQL